MLKKLNIKLVISVNNLVYLPLLLPGDIGKKTDKFIRKRSYHIKKRRFNKNDEKIFRKPKGKNIKPSKGKCVNCGKKGHYADKCPNPPGKLKKIKLNH
jgi:hypothetical protein